MRTVISRQADSDDSSPLVGANTGPATETGRSTVRERIDRPEHRPKSPELDELTHVGQAPRCSRSATISPTVFLLTTSDAST